MTDNTGHIKIYSDNWDDIGKIYNVLTYKRMSTDSTAVHLQLEYEGVLYNRVVAVHQIEWVD